jgi:hypothetical protein
MANYSKRDARKEWVETMAANRDRLRDQCPRCHCGAEAVIAYTPQTGPSRFFCTAHEAEADVLFKSVERQ